MLLIVQVKALFSLKVNVQLKHVVKQLLLAPLGLGSPVKKHATRPYECQLRCVQYETANTGLRPQMETEVKKY